MDRCAGPLRHRGAARDAGPRDPPPARPGPEKDPRRPRRRRPPGERATRAVRLRARVARGADEAEVAARRRSCRHRDRAARRRCPRGRDLPDDGRDPRHDRAPPDRARARRARSAPGAVHVARHGELRAPRAVSSSTSTRLCVEATGDDPASRGSWLWRAGWWRARGSGPAQRPAGCGCGKPLFTRSIEDWEHAIAAWSRDPDEGVA